KRNAARVPRALIVVGAGLADVSVVDGEAVAGAGHEVARRGGGARALGPEAALHAVALRAYRGSTVAVGALAAGAARAAAAALADGRRIRAVAALRTPDALIVAAQVAGVEVARGSASNAGGIAAAGLDAQQAVRALGLADVAGVIAGV